MYRPKKIYIEKGTEDLPFTRSLLSRISDVPFEIISDKKCILNEIKQQPDPIGAGKRFLYLTRDLGRAFKPFPTPEGTISCQFHSLHLMEGCDLECSYCILQTYLTHPLLTVYVNIEEILKNLDAFLKQNPGETFRIGTGQLTDSLSFDHLTAHTEFLVPFFADQPNAILELKTKSVNIERLKKLDPKGRTIVSWSINTPRIQQEEEHKCASIGERLTAAKQCLEWEYRVGFHLDPIVDYVGCLEEYEALIEKIFSEIPAGKIAWMSLGSLRFMPELKDIMEKRFPKSPLPYGEWVRGMDGKMRYFKERRVELYSALVKKIRSLAPNITLYLCMETEEVWKKTFQESFDPVVQLNHACRS